MRDHKKFSAFELTDEIVIMIYEMTKAFPQNESYGLTSQMGQAAISVPSNIVEGCVPENQAEYIRLLDIAFGS